MATELALTGTVTEVKSNRSIWSRLLGIHTLGVGHTRVEERQLLLRTDAEIVAVHLAPAPFLKEKKVEIRKGDSLQVIGSRIILGQTQVLLARQIRRADSTWTLRDATGQPLWDSAQARRRGFWTTKKVLLTVVIVKAVALATVLRH